MAKPGLLFLKTIILLLSLATLTSSTISITNPSTTTFPNNTLNYYYANYGQVPYGKSLKFDVIFINNNLCGSIQELEHLKKPSYIILRSSLDVSCNYPKRAINAQKLGAKGIIIATDSVKYSTGKVMMVDDGNGKKVHITCLFISIEDYDKLKDLDTGKDDVQIMVKFMVPKEKISQIKIFLSASDRHSYAFLHKFNEYFSLLKNHINFEPLYNTIDCQFCSQQDCLLKNYCEYDNTHYIFGEGQKIILQAIRQYKIYQKKGTQIYLRYMRQFDEYCTQDWNMAYECSNNKMKDLGISGINGGSMPLSLLSQWRIKEHRIGFDSFPEISINNMIYRGNADMKEVFGAICQSLEKPPQGCSDKVTVDQPKEDSGYNGLFIIFGLFGLMTLIGIMAICVYKRVVPKEITNDMSSKVDELVAKYASTVSQQNKKRKDRLKESLSQEL